MTFLKKISPLKDLQSQVNGFEWQLSEKDSQIEDLETQVQALSQSGDDNSEAIDNSNLKIELIGLKRQVTELEASNAMLKRQVEELGNYPQCGNLSIFLSLRFYVKSILENQESPKTAVFAIFGALNLVNLVNSRLAKSAKIQTN